MVRYSFVGVSHVVSHRFAGRELQSLWLFGAIFPRRIRAADFRWRSWLAGVRGDGGGAGHLNPVAAAVVAGVVFGAGGCVVVFPGAAVRAGDSARGLPVYAGAGHVHTGDAGSFCELWVADADRGPVCCRGWPRFGVADGGGGAESVCAVFAVRVWRGGNCSTRCAYTVLGWVFANQLGVIVQVLEGCGGAVDGGGGGADSCLRRGTKAGDAVVAESGRDAHDCD